MADLQGQVFWPGVIAARSCIYTMGHGITPGVANLEVLPQLLVPAIEGNLVITDNLNTVLLPDCRVDSIRAEKDSGGTRYYLTIKDRRWRWKNCGGISGQYNIVDNSGQYSKQVPDALNAYNTRLARPTKYIPWTLRTPYQLALLCLAAMGEADAIVDMPDDVNTLPEIHWDWTNPAQALQSLCTQFNRRIVYDWFNDVVCIVQLGVGLDLPDGSYSMDAPAFTNLQRPDSIILVGAPNRYQILLKLEAVGEDWDGSIRPINDLSYTPPPFKTGAGPQVSNVSITNPANLAIYTITINGDEVNYVGTNADLTTTYNGLIANLKSTGVANAFDLTMAIVTIPPAVNPSLQITGKVDGTPFNINVKVQNSSSTNATIAVTTVGGSVIDKKWFYSKPPDYANVEATDQLTKQQAISLAKKSVFKWYRITPINPQNDAYPFYVPSYGFVYRREQFLLQKQTVLPIQPIDADANFITAWGEQYQQVIYDSTYRNQPARCYGAFATEETNSQGLCYTNPEVEGNTQIGTRIPIPFEIDQETQTVRFSQPVYEIDVDGVIEATVFLETAVQILDPTTNSVTRYVATFTFPDPSDTPPVIIRREDVQANYINTYDYAQGILLGSFQDTDVADATAQYYLATAASQYFVTAGARRNYNGIMPIILDGLRQQVTWEVGSGGAKTTASTNGEHEIFYPSYPERLRLEYLSPAQQEEAKNAKPANKGKKITEPLE